MVDGSFFSSSFFFVFSVFVECLENGECPKTTRINVIIRELDALSRNVNDAGFNHIVIFQVHFSQQTKNSLLNRIVIWPNWKCRIRFNFYLMELHKRDDWLHIFVMCWRDLVRGFSVSKCLFFRPIEIWSMNFYSNSMSLVSMPSMANVTLFLLILPLCVRACKCVCVSKLRSVYNQNKTKMKIKSES